MSRIRVPLEPPYYVVHAARHLTSAEVAWLYGLEPHEWRPAKRWAPHEPGKVHLGLRPGEYSREAAEWALAAARGA